MVSANERPRETEGMAEVGGHYGAMTHKHQDPGEGPVPEKEHGGSNKMCASVSAMAAA